jgi:hypothetical protein
MEENIKEMTKWKYVTFAAIPVCIGMAIYDLSGNFPVAILRGGLARFHTLNEDCHAGKGSLSRFELFCC